MLQMLVLTADTNTTNILVTDTDGKKITHTVVLDDKLLTKLLMVI